MAWTTPITWTSLQLVNETTLNAQIKANMDYLYAAVADPGLHPFLLIGA